MHYGIDPRKVTGPLNSKTAPLALPPNKQNYNQLNIKGKALLTIKRHSHNLIMSKTKSSSAADFYSNSNEIAKTPISSTQRMNRIFDRFIQLVENQPLHLAVENATQELFSLQTVNCWNVCINFDNFVSKNPVLNEERRLTLENYESNTTLYSQKLSKALIVKTTKSILTKFVRMRFQKQSDTDSNNLSIYFSNPPNDPDYNPEVDYPHPTLLLPVYDDEDRLFLIIELVDSPSSSNGAQKAKTGFNEDDEKLANNFSIKLSMYSHFFNASETIHAILTQSKQTLVNEKILFTEIHHKLKNILQCRVVEYWARDLYETCIMKYSDNAGQFIAVNKDSCGVVREIFENDIGFINILNVKDSPYYSPDNDGKSDESVLMHLLPIEENTCAVVFRGKLKGHFTSIDERIMTYLIPLISQLFVECHQKEIQQQAKSQTEKSATLSSRSNAMYTAQTAQLSERLAALLDVAENISGVLDIDILIPTIMERACSLLNTERCSLFLVDPIKQELITRFHGGLSKSIRIPLKKGIVGHTATTGKIVNIVDAYSDSRFDNHVDLATGFRTKTILTVPIYNNRGEIAGVTEMINKMDDGVFDDDDIKMLMAFNVFCGISLDNAKLYTSSLDLTRQLRSFVEMSTALNNEKKISNVLSEIITTAKNLIHASRATIFMMEGDELMPFVTVGDPIKHGTLFAKDVMKSGDRNPHIFPREEIFLKLQSVSDKPLDGFGGTPLNKDQNEHTISSSTSSRLLNVLVNDSSSGVSVGEDQMYESLCGIHLVSSDSKVIGVLELSSNGKIMPEDLKLLDCFAVFATVSIERSALQEIADLGEIEVQMKQYLTSEERKRFHIPAKMKLDVDNLFQLNFDAVAYDGIGHFKVLWKIFDTFDLLNEFNVSNEKFFRFMIEISQTYKKVPYHNWRHAVDVCQFTTYEIKLTNLDAQLTKFELFGFVVAAICHDANHDGFTNVYNEKAETPLGILYKNQSVMETHHCTVAITVISKEECNLFSNLNADQYKDMWNLIFQLILITDMAKHFDFLKMIGADLDRDGPYDMSKDENRLKVMQLILKCGDISNVSRPFELADKWCDVLCEEFFRQGDLEMANGMEYTSNLNDREHLDKPKSQIGFYTFVCLPLYTLAARAFPALQANVDQIQSNLAIWKAATEQNQEKKE